MTTNVLTTREGTQAVSSEVSSALNAKSVTVTVSDPGATSRYHRALILLGLFAHGI